MPFIYLLIALLMAPGIFASVGHVVQLKGEAVVNRLGVDSPLAMNSPLEQGDLLKTSPKSFLKIELHDKTSIALGPEAQLRLTLVQSQLNLRQHIITLLNGKLRAVVEQKAKDGESISFRTPTVSLGVRGTHFLANVAPVLGIPSSDVALLEGRLAADLSPGKIPLKEFVLEEGQYFSTHQLAKDQSLDSIKKLAKEQIEQMLQNGEAFLPDLIDSAGNLLTPAIGALGLGGVVVALSSTPAAMVGGHREQEQISPAAENVKREVVTQVVYRERPVEDPEDIRTAKEQREELRQQNSCYFWIYKVIPGAAAERFRRERKCDEYDYDL